ncbi:protein D3-like [Planococcus citri]|uniref:protein D3-like n=1 Tax=Planococcus citri TaxID=170843 RepID=UPI0031F73EAB
MFHQFLLLATIFHLINSQCDRWRQEGSDYSEESTVDPNRLIDTMEALVWEEQESIATKFITHNLVPDLISLPPRFRCHAWFPGSISPVEVKPGIELLQSDLLSAPCNMSWRDILDDLYTVFLTTPDYPTAPNSDKSRQLHHWLLINVQSSDINSGDTVLDYLVPQVVRASNTSNTNRGYARYAFLVYEQPNKFPAPKIKRNGLNASFTIKQFVQKHKLGNPKFGNYFLVNYE